MATQLREYRAELRSVKREIRAIVSSVKKSHRAIKRAHKALDREWDKTKRFGASKLQRLERRRGILEGRLQ